MNVNILYRNNFTNIKGSEAENNFVLLKAMHLARGQLVDNPCSS
jgi:hypothetical protein